MKSLKGHKNYPDLQARFLTPFKFHTVKKKITYVEKLTVYCYQLQSLFYLQFPAEHSLPHLQGCRSDKTLPVN